MKKNLLAIFFIMLGLGSAGAVQRDDGAVDSPETAVQQLDALWATALDVTMFARPASQGRPSVDRAAVLDSAYGLKTISPKVPAPPFAEPARMLVLGALLIGLSNFFKNRFVARK